MLLTCFLHVSYSVSYIISPADVDADVRMLADFASACCTMPGLPNHLRASALLLAAVHWDLQHKHQYSVQVLQQCVQQLLQSGLFTELLTAADVEHDGRAAATAVLLLLKAVQRAPSIAGSIDSRAVASTAGQ